MSAFSRCFRRSGGQGSILNDGTHPSYGAIEAALAGVHNIETRNRLLNHPLIRKARDTGIIAKTIIVLLTILFTLICIAITAAITSAFCGACIVAGHWILVHLSCPQSPYSHVSFWSTFLVGFWGSMAVFLPFDCAVGVPLVGHYYGIETLGLEYAVGAAYTAWAYKVVPDVQSPVLNYVETSWSTKALVRLDKTAIG
ncbi:hypothetical protein ARMGADRAFT_1022857 [Armillaria gallica]|uniref:Uncharacterized protein n=1 Tax=Armillaria gallica TaxID=47427 RepID=A0A2H3EAK7_ARMGA|nr:hypothetical protein ARMGADRAFT_1022857 [Armillaria gallica]